MTNRELIEKLFISELDSKDEAELIEKLADKTGKSVKDIKSAIKSCKNSKKTLTGFRGCLNRKLRLGGPTGP